MNLGAPAHRAASLALALGLFAGCGPKLPSEEELAAFHAAGPVRPQINMEKLEKARATTGPYQAGPGDLLELQMQTVAAPAATGGGQAEEEKPKRTPAERPEPKPPAGPYRVVPGDVVEVEMPAILRAVGVQVPEGVVSYARRVGKDGTIPLPAAGEVKVAGKTLGEIDEAVVSAYYPKLVRKRPSVLAHVREYHTVPVSIVGAVGQPGRYSLRSDELSLFAALMKAGGLSSQASRILIRSPREKAPLVVPLKGPDVPAANVSLAAGDIVEVERQFTREEGGEPFVCRVDEEGRIRVPGCGKIPVEGKTLPEIETTVAAAYASGAEEARPTVLARLVQPHVAEVTILGGVETPGRYELPRDELSLVSLLMKAGGILPTGAGLIRIRHARGSEDPETVALPVRDVNVPFADVALKDGDTVEVVRLEERVFTILGLVNAPGTFPYPQMARYNIAQAVAVAGGFDQVADPRYLSIYRQDAEGKLVSARFKVEGNRLGENANLPVRAGDIILVEHTLRTRTRKFFSNLFRTGVFVGASYRLGNR